MKAKDIAKVKTLIYGLISDLEDMRKKAVEAKQSVGLNTDANDSWWTGRAIAFQHATYCLMHAFVEFEEANKEV